MMKHIWEPGTYTVSRFHREMECGSPMSLPCPVHLLQVDKRETSLKLVLSVVSVLHPINHTVKATCPGDPKQLSRWHQPIAAKMSQWVLTRWRSSGGNTVVTASTGRIMASSFSSVRVQTLKVYHNSKPKDFLKTHCNTCVHQIFITDKYLRKST